MSKAALLPLTDCVSGGPRPYDVCAGKDLEDIGRIPEQAEVARCAGQSKFTRERAFQGKAQVTGNVVDGRLGPDEVWRAAGILAVVGVVEREVVARELELPWRGAGRRPVKGDVVVARAETHRGVVLAENVVGTPNSLKPLIALNAHGCLSKLQGRGKLHAREAAEGQPVPWNQADGKVGPPLDVRKRIAELKRRKLGGGERGFKSIGQAGDTLRFRTAGAGGRRSICGYADEVMA